jgi:hypothetical protein
MAQAGVGADQVDAMPGVAAEVVRVALS